MYNGFHTELGKQKKNNESCSIDFSCEFLFSVFSGNWQLHCIDI